VNDDWEGEKGVKAAEDGNEGEASLANTGTLASLGVQSDDAPASDAGLPAQVGDGKSKKKAFKSDESYKQFSTMIRNHAFSSGCQSYKQFERNAGASRTETSWRARGEQLKELDDQRKSFFGRHPSSFGVELLTDSDIRAWDVGARSLAQRSASEGALLRYARDSAESMARSVKENLGVDVSTVTRKQMRKSSFAARLDVAGISANPTDPSSATGQAVRKLCSYEPSQKTVLPVLNASKR